MNILNEKIKIELRSDLCAGSGYSYAGIVDSDICYDDCGIPYIPAKRIKGCMREVLDTLLYSKYPDCVDTLFGSWGESDYDTPGDDSSTEIIRIGNAYIEDYDVIHAFILRHQKFNNTKLYEAEDILDRFTHVVGQTKMENGVADNTTLRYTRVVNQYFPMLGTDSSVVKPIVFVADISINKDDKEVIEDILNATRHIGLKRNRGFGLVKCSFSDGNGGKAVSNNCVTKAGSDRIRVEKLNDDRSRIWFALRNTEPLMLSGSKEDITKDYISGQSVIGVLVGRYLKSHGKGSAETSEFKDLFLNGVTEYSHLYPCVGNRIHFPAPEYLNILKKTKKYVFTHGETLPEVSSLPQNIVEDYDWRNGNQPKKLKGKYVSLTHDNLSVVEVSKDIIYHNRHSNDDNDGILYSSEVITSGQVFAGFIDVPEKYKDTLLALLNADEFYFGKSRTAQYGHCEMTDAHNILIDNLNDEKIEAGHPILITFLSDTVLLKVNDERDTDDPCEYTVYYDEIKRTVMKELGITEHVNSFNHDYISSIQTTLITGYKGVWNLRRSPIPAIKAGSSLVIYTKEGYKPSKFSIGEFVHEGYGRISITNAENYSYLNVPEEINLSLNANGSCVNTDKDQIVETQKEKIRSIIIPIFVEKWLNEKINTAISSNDYSLKGSESAVGRWKLMLMESIAKKDDENKRDEKEPYEDFKDRIRSIKKPSSKEQGEKLIKWADEFRKEAKKENNECIESVKKLGLLADSDNEISNIHKIMMDRWSDYIMAILVNRKYMGKGE